MDARRLRGDEGAPPEGAPGGTGAVVLTFLFLVFGAVLLALTPWQTSPAPPGKEWSTEPALAPAAFLVILVVPAGFLLAAGLRTRLGAGGPGLRLRPAPHELHAARMVLEFALYLVLYVWLIDKLGYLLSSFLFAFVGCGRLGLRGWRTVAFAVLLAVALAGVFRAGLGIWMPGAAIYEYLPAELRNFALLRL